MVKAKRSQRGFTLVELSVVVGILAILAVIVIPNLSGFLAGGEKQGYNADRKIVQAAVSTWHSDPDNRVGSYPYPTNTGIGSDNSAVTGAHVSMPMLVSGDYLFEVPASASSSNGGTGPGHYTWYVNSKGRVLSTPTFTAGVYP